MKKIEAIVRKTHFEDVKQALFEADINWFSYSEVKAVGQDREDRIYRGVMYSTDVISRIEITIVCRDQFVEPAIQAIMASARTGASPSATSSTHGPSGPANMETPFSATRSRTLKTKES